MLTMNTKTNSIFEDYEILRQSLGKGYLYLKLFNLKIIFLTFLDQDQMVKYYVVLKRTLI